MSFARKEQRYNIVIDTVIIYIYYIYIYLIYIYIQLYIYACVYIYIPRPSKGVKLQPQTVCFLMGFSGPKFQTLGRFRYID